MSVHLCARRLPRQAAACQTLLAPSTLPFRISSYRSLSTTPSRHLPAAQTSSNPLLDKYLAKKNRKEAPSAAPKLETGDLASGSIFDGEGREAVREKQQAPQQGPQQGDQVVIKPLEQRNPNYMRLALDPNPENRQNWERKMVIRQIKRRGRLTKEEVLKRTERQSLTKSPWLKTSIKKLTKLAHQVAGKNIDDAIVQMQFSKKKAAQDVKKILEHAKNKAIVSRGMGLEDSLANPTEIELKDGKRKVVRNTSDMYVDQAWVGRGAFTFELEYRARGRRNLLRKPWTSISVLLKEEKTRIRLHEERQEKRRNRKLWVQLPDRPITAQRQYCVW